jgi:hypothetical protein
MDSSVHFIAAVRLLARAAGKQFVALLRGCVLCFLCVFDVVPGLMGSSKRIDKWSMK